MTNPNLRALVDLRDRQIQKTRIQFGNRLDAISRDADDTGDSPQLEIILKWHKIFSDLESELDKDIGAIVSQHPIYDSVVAIKGVGPMLAAKLISMINITRSNTVSQLWRYSGYAVINGEIERPTKGTKLAYNKRLKSTCYLIAVSFLRSSSPYRHLYDTKKEFYVNTKPDWTAAHSHNAALRYMIKRFLAHLWLEWRVIEGQHTRLPYVQEKMEHTHIDTPQMYGWPSRKKRETPLPDASQTQRETQECYASQLHYGIQIESASQKMNNIQVKHASQQ